MTGRMFLRPHKARRMRRKWYACVMEKSDWHGVRVCKDICEAKCPYQKDKKCGRYDEALKGRRVKR